MTPEEVATRTRLEQEAGRNAVRDTEAKPKDSRGMEGRDTSPFIEFVEPSTAQEWGQLPIDPDVKLPADIQVTIARGKAAYRKFKKSWRKQELIRPKGPAGGPSLITSVVDKEVQDRRDAALSALEKQSEGRTTAYAISSTRRAAPSLTGAGLRGCLLTPAQTAG